MSENGAEFENCGRDTRDDNRTGQPTTPKADVNTMRVEEIIFVKQRESLVPQ
jgi:hypothetical protein